MAYQIILSKQFLNCINSPHQADRYIPQLLKTMHELCREPFGNPRLSTHGIGAARNGSKLYSSDVGGRANDRRVVWQLIGQKTIVLLLYGSHKVQDRAKRMQISFDPQQQLVQVQEQAPDFEAKRSYREHRETTGTLFMAWTDGELIDLGFPEPTVEHLRRLNNADELEALEEHLGPQLFELALEIITSEPPVRSISTADTSKAPESPVYRQPEASPSVETGAAKAPVAPPEVSEPEVSDEDRELERLLNDERTGALFARVEPEFLVDVIGQPIEDWMIFLHPDQRATVNRRYQGPARVRGPAGTGKTVVGLHRAAHLAARNRAVEATGPASDGKPALPVLVTTYISSLPPVFEELYGRIPGTRPGEVEFLTVNTLASHVCKEVGKRAFVNRHKVNTAYEQAFKQVVLPGTPLYGLTPNYLRDEITKILKGRAIESLEDYLGIERIGRRMPLDRPKRTQVWELMQRWDAEMDRHGTMDFDDVILQALRVARESNRPRYSAVIVDEAQDLTMAGLQFLRALVNAPNHDTDRPDGLFILGDGAQRIYPGGFKLRQAGVEVRGGRTTVLTENYRNTGQIISAALAVAGDHRVEDLEEEFQRGDEAVATSRQGPSPLRVVVHGRTEKQAKAIAQYIEDFAAEDKNLGYGDMAVLAWKNTQVEKLSNWLKKLELTVQSLEGYDGRPSDKVKIGTYDRAKGLEFKVVFLPLLESSPPNPRPGQGDEESAESYELYMSRLFVAMTRARDQLVVLHSLNGSKAIDSATDYFKKLIMRYPD